jgi:hypothetical protein
VCKYAAHFSDKGYAVGADFWGWLEETVAAEVAEGLLSQEEAATAVASASELWCIKGSRNGSFFFNAAVVRRSAALTTPPPASAPLAHRCFVRLGQPGRFKQYLDEESEMAKKAGKLRESIREGYATQEVSSQLASSHIAADVRVACR